MVIRGENLALLGESVTDVPLIEAPLDVVLRRQDEINRANMLDQQQSNRVAVDLGFLDDI